MIDSLWVSRLCNLTIYSMKYNYSLAQHVKDNPEKFDPKTIEMYEMRPPAYWETEKTFLDLFSYLLELSIGRIGLDFKILNYSKINEELAAYDETLPQHYGVSTAALDWTRNPLIAIYFAIEKIPSDATSFSVYVFREINCNINNPFSLDNGNAECQNIRIQRQEGLFIRFKYASLYYFVHGNWPSMETYLPLGKNNFELIKYSIPVCHVPYFKNILDEKGITKEFLFPDLKILELV